MQNLHKHKFFQENFRIWGFKNIKDHQTPKYTVLSEVSIDKSIDARFLQQSLSDIFFQIS